MPHALITGASGFVGSHLLHRLVREGWSVRALVRDEGRLSTPATGIQEVVTGTLSDPEALATAVRDVDIVFHCAANVATWASEAEYFNVNVRGTDNLLSAIIRHNPNISRLVYLSTVDVYGFPSTPADEETAPNCQEYGYGLSKLQGEISLTQRAKNQGIPLTIIRPCNIIGPGSQFIERIGSALSNGIMLTIAGGKEPAGLICVDNLIDCLIWSAQNNICRNQIYNIRDPADITWADVITIFRREIGGKGVVINLPFWLAAPIASILGTIGKTLAPSVEPLLHPLIVRIFGRTCGHSIEKIRAHGAPLGRVDTLLGLKQAICWYQKNHA